MKITKILKSDFLSVTLRSFHRFISLSKSILSSFFSCDVDWWFLVSVKFNGESCRRQNNNIYTHRGSKGIEIWSDPSHTGESKLINTVNHLWSGTCFVFRGNKSAFKDVQVTKEAQIITAVCAAFRNKHVNAENMFVCFYLLFCHIMNYFQSSFTLLLKHISYLTHTLSDTQPYLTFLYQFTPHGNINSDVLNII